MVPVLAVRLRRLIAIEPAYLGIESSASLHQMYTAVVSSNLHRKTSWETVVAAMEWVTTHRPWNTYHPDVLKIISVSYFTFVVIIHSLSFPACLYGLPEPRIHTFAMTHKIPIVLS